MSLEIRTPTKWGSTVSTCIGGSCLPADDKGNIDDILAAIAKFQGADNARFTWIDIAPSTGSAVPDQKVELSDILSALDGFKGRPYPGNGPLGCGSVVP